MYSAILIILGYILVAFETVWYITCTEHRDIPLIIVLLIILLSLIPGLNCIMALVNFIILAFIVHEDVLKLKNNWFNRTFLAYHDEQ